MAATFQSLAITSTVLVQDHFCSDFLDTLDVHETTLKSAMMNAEHWLPTISLRSPQLMSFEQLGST